MASFLDQILGSSGIPSSPTSQLISTSSISPWAQPYVSSYLQRAQNLSTQAPSAFQNQVASSAQGMGMPEQFAMGTNLANQGGQGSLSTAPMALNYGQMGADIGQKGIGIGQAGMQYGMNAGSNYAQQATNPYAVGAYMNPFIQNALAPQLQLLNQQQALGAQDIAGKATGQGAFGGNRATLAQGLNAQNYALAKQQAAGQAYTDAFKQAQQAQQFGSTLGLQGAMQGTQLGLSGIDTALKGTGVGLQGVSGAQQGYQGATQAGAALGNIGAQQGQYELAKIALQNQIANQQYNQPWQNLQNMQGMMSGLPVSMSTQQGYQAPPNYLSQGVGALSTAAGIYGIGKDAGWWGGASGGGGSYIPNASSWMDNRDVGESLTSLSGASAADLPYDVIAKGGQITKDGVKRYAKGGKVNYSTGGDINLIPTDKLAPMMQNPNISPMDAALIQEELMIRSRMQGNPQTGQIMGGGLGSIPSGDMFRAAGGGIVAFAEGDVVRSSSSTPSKIRPEIKDYQSWLESQIRASIENQDQTNPFQRSQALEDKYAQEMTQRKSARPYEALLNFGLGALSGESPYAMTNLGKAGTYALQQQQKMSAEDAADRKLMLQQAVEQEKSKYARDTGRQNAMQTALGQMYSREIGLKNASATSASTQAYRDQLLAQKYATLWKDTLDDTKSSLLKQTKFNTIYMKDPVAFNRLAEQEAKRNMPPTALEILGKTPALMDTDTGGGAPSKAGTVPALPKGFVVQ